MKCNLWHEMERCRYYKVCVTYFFFFFFLTVVRFLVVLVFFFRCQPCVQTCNNVLAHAGRLCSKTVRERPVSLTTVCADCGRLAVVFLSFIKSLFLLVHWNVGSDFPGQMFVCLWRTGRSFHWTVLLDVCVFGTRTTVISRFYYFHFFFFSASSKYFLTISVSFYIPTSCIRSFIYWKLNRMGSFFLMYTVYKCTMSIFLWCPTTICIRNGQ